MQGSVRKDEVERLFSLPGGNVGLLPGNRRKAAGRLVEHCRIAVDTGNPCLRPLSGKQAGNITGATTQVDDVVRRLADKPRE
jgi:hypothetical protein